MSDKCNLQNNLINFINSSSQDRVKGTATDGVLTLSCDSAIDSNNLVLIGGVKDPSTAQQAATKAYVDSNTTGSVLLVPSTTQTIQTHPLVLSANITSSSTTSGSLVVTGGAGVSADLNVGGDISCVNLSTTSDERKKKNIRPLGTDDRFDKIQPVSFNFKHDNKLSNGIIAQQLRQLYPEMVSESVETGMLSVNYLELIAVLIAEVQALKKL